MNEPTKSLLRYEFTSFPSHVANLGGSSLVNGVQILPGKLGNWFSQLKPQCGGRAG